MSRRLFFSPVLLVEDIEAVNVKSSSVIDLSAGEVAFVVPSDGFIFDKDLMQQHFNENYMESEKYPKSIFKGKIKDWKAYERKKTVTVIGEMSIHGQTNTVTLSGDLDIKGSKIVIDAKFPISLADYKIKIPKVVFYNIAETVEVTIHFEYKPYTD